MPLAKRQPGDGLVQRPHGEVGARAARDEDGAFGVVAQPGVLRQQILLRREDAADHLVVEMRPHDLRFAS
jgi:hypothetical protein